MSQHEIYKFLKEHKNKWFNSKDLVKEIGLNNNTIINNLKRLRSFNNIAFERRRDKLEVTNYVGKDITLRKHRFYYRYEEVRE